MTKPFGLTSSFMTALAEQGMPVLPALKEASAADLAPHGTTIVALTYPGGVLLAGDRRATMGNLIANRDMRKVYQADDYSAVGIAGTAGTAIEMVRLFRVELEHYEKIEGTLMSFEGKANRLSFMVRGNLPMAMQGLSVVPMFAGFDLDEERGRIFSYDVTGGRYEEVAHHAVGSGSLFARGSMKKLYRPNGSRDEAIRCALEALWDAADDDSATGGPDLARGIFPIVATIDKDGYREVDQDTCRTMVERIASARTRDFDTSSPMGGDA